MSLKQGVACGNEENTLNNKNRNHVFEISKFCITDYFKNLKTTDFVRGRLMEEDASHETIEVCFRV